jgi:uncharacterized protein (DUF362 family)
MRRRDFLRQVAAGSALATLTPSTSCARRREPGGGGARPVKDPRLAPVTGRAKVVLVKAGGVVGEGNQIQRKRLRRMLETGLLRLTGASDARAALGRFLRPVDTVGLKVNCLAGRRMSTHVALVEELVALLAAGGLPRKQAVVFDRSDRDLRLAGFPIRTYGQDYLSLGNDRAGYEKDLRVMPSGASRFSKVATRKASVLINLPILKDHGLAGITAALKNNFGLVHNPNKFHLNGCDPHVAEVNAQSFLRRKQKLIICDALQVQVEGGPAFYPAGVVTHDALLLATDPVAMDVVAWEILEQLRKARKLPSLKKDKREPKHIATAARMGLGVGDRGRIDLVTVQLKV